MKLAPLLSLIFAAVLDHATGKDLNILDSTRFLNLEEIYDFLETLAERAPDVMQLKTIGNTKMEGKDWSNNIYVVKIGDDSKPKMLFDCGIHSREWISPASCLYIIQKLVLVHKLAENRKLKTSVLNYQWNIIPVLNPDGYNITHSGGPKSRLHRKNARPLSTMKLNTDNYGSQCERVCERNRRSARQHDSCFGVDLNRNFPAGWGLGAQNFVSGSKLVCEDVYKGEKYLSEPETQALDNYVREIRDNLLSAISVHSYGAVIDYPNGWMFEGDPGQVKGKDLERLRKFVTGFAKRLKYKYGFVYEVFGGGSVAGGASEDFYFNYHDIKIAYTIELDPQNAPPRVSGFVMEPKKIKSVAKKLWHAFQQMAYDMDKIKDELMELNAQRKV